MNLEGLSTEQLEELVNSGKLRDLAPQALKLGPFVDTSDPEGRSSSSEIYDKKTIKTLVKTTSEGGKASISGESEVDLRLPAEQVSDSNNPPSAADTTVAERVLAARAAEEAGRTREATRGEGFEFDDPVDLLYFLDDDVSSGATKLHPWQIQFMMDFALQTHTKDLPFQAAVQACNGSGKDKYIVAACIVWLCMRYLYARGVATNGSGDQLDNQTELHIEWLCKQANKKIGYPVWKCNYRYYECLPTASPIKLFATDEPGKAEGYHPLRTGAKMAIFASEAKSIPSEIFDALERCHGFTHRVDVSSPGLQTGNFYDVCMTGIDRKGIGDIKSVPPINVIKYLVTYRDCPHITELEADRMAAKLKGGRTNAIFRSSMLSEFCTTDEMVVINSTDVWHCVNSPTKDWIQEPFNKAGLDLSDGGDETCLVVRNGNKHLATIPIRDIENTEDTIAFLQEKFAEWNLNKPEAYIYADCGGLGKPMLDRLKRLGWTNIRYVDNRHTPFEPRTYKNRGAEIWFHSSILFEQRCLILTYDKELITQLSTRYYKITPNNTHQLLSKMESRSRGFPSPDRADAFVLAFWDYKSKYHEFTPPAEDKLPFKNAAPAPIKSDFSIIEWAKRGEGSSSIPSFSKGKDFSLYQREIERYNQELSLGLRSKPVKTVEERPIYAS